MFASLNLLRSLFGQSTFLFSFFFFSFLNPKFRDLVRTLSPRRARSLCIFIIQCLGFHYLVSSTFQVPKMASLQIFPSWDPTYDEFFLCTQKEETTPTRVFFFFFSFFLFFCFFFFLFLMHLQQKNFCTYIKTT